MLYYQHSSLYYLLLVHLQLSSLAHLLLDLLLNQSFVVWTYRFATIAGYVQLIHTAYYQQMDVRQLYLLYEHSNDAKV